MNDLALKKCFNHAVREAVAVCPECNSFFCRECIVEHHGRIVCSSCLENLFASKVNRQFKLGPVIRLGQFSFGFFMAWFIFYYISIGLLSIPTSFHEGTILEKLGGF